MYNNNKVATTRERSHKNCCCCYGFFSDSGEILYRENGKEKVIHRSNSTASYSGPVHIPQEKFQNAALFFRLGTDP